VNILTYEGGRKR